MKKITLLILMFALLATQFSQTAAASPLAPKPATVLDEEIMIVSGYVVGLGYHPSDARKTAYAEMFALLAEVEVVTGWNLYDIVIVDEGLLTDILYFVEFDGYFHPPGK